MTTHHPPTTLAPTTSTITMMNGILQMGSGPSQISAAFNPPHHPHYNSNPQHHTHHPHHPHHPHFGQLYQQQRPSFAIQELLGLGCPRQHASPSPVPDNNSLVDPSAGLANSLSGVTNSLSGMTNSLGGVPYFHGGHSGHHQSLQVEAAQSQLPPGYPTPHHGHHHAGGAGSGLGAGSVGLGAGSGGLSGSLGGGPGGLYPWRFDLTPTTSPQSLPPPRLHGVRHGEEVAYSYKHNIADDGESE